MPLVKVALAKPLVCPKQAIFLNESISTCKPVTVTVTLSVFTIGTPPAQGK